MKKKIQRKIYLTMLGMVLVLLQIGTASAQLVNITSYTGPTVEIDNQFDVPIPATFVVGDFPAGETIIDVDISIDWTKSGLDCPTRIGNPFHGETRLRLESPDGTVIELVNFDTYTGNVVIGDVITTFDDSAAVPPGPGAPVSGTFRPTGPGMLANFNGENPVGTWNVLGSDDVLFDPLCVNSYELTVTVGSVLDAVEAVLDHFECYEANGRNARETVDLEDQFGVDREVEVHKPKLFCNPVDKNGEGILNSLAHLTCYKIEIEEEEERRVEVNNQFDEQQILRVKEPKLICVPSEKTSVTLIDDNSDSD